MRITRAGICEIHPLIYGGVLECSIRSSADENTLEPTMRGFSEVGNR